MKDAAMNELACCQWQVMSHRSWFIGAGTPWIMASLEGPHGCGWLVQEKLCLNFGLEDVVAGPMGQYLVDFSG